MFFFKRNKKDSKTINKPVADHIKILDENIALDFYIGGREFIDGIDNSAKERIESFSEELFSNLKKESLSCPGLYRFQEKNYGYGADWILALVEFVANNDWLSAAAKVGGLITLGKHIKDFVKKKSDQSIFLGIKTARLVAINAISEMVEIRDVELLSEYELDRGEAGFTDKEYLFVLGINRQELTPQDIFNKDTVYRGVIFVVRIGWRGEVKSTNKF